MLFRHRLARDLVLFLSIIIVGGCSDNSSSDTPSTSESATPAEDSTSPPIIESNPSLQDQFQQVVDAAVESGLPGVSLHVQQSDESASITAGVVNQDTAEPVTPTSLFQIASIGKSYVATMFLRFADMGMLQLDDTIERWLDPDMSAMVADTDLITLEMLLAHTSGIPDYVNGDTSYILDVIESPGRVRTATEALSYINGMDNLFQPGDEFRYSNTNYLLLGVIAERVTGLPLGTALRNWVFEPAGLENTYGAFEDLGQPELAHGYMPSSLFEGANIDLDLPADGSDLDTFEWLRSDGFGDAPIHSTPSDMNLFIRTLIDTEVLVAGELKTRMLSESFPGSSEYGLGIVVIDETNDPVLYGHDGKFLGLNSLLLYAPSLDTSFATTVNASDGTFQLLFNAYVDQLLSVLGDNMQETARQ